ncbi:helix-turn-helix domain-containing protein [Gordonia iterans]
MPVPESSLSLAEKQVRRMRREAVGWAIKQRRTAKGLTQQDLAGISGVSRPAIARMETGQASTQIDRLWDIAAALDTSPSDLLSAAEHYVRDAR